jgi:HlyD family secretion protein
LYPAHAIQQSEVDRSKANYDATRAQLAQSDASIASLKAQLAQAKWQLDQKVLVAPVNSQVFDVYYRLGEFVPANQAILSLLAPQDIKVIFFVREKILSKLKLNDLVQIRCNSCAKDYDAHISFISPQAEYTPPLLFSDDTNEKLIYRLEARLNLQDAKDMHPGQPVKVLYYPHD